MTAPAITLTDAPDPSARQAVLSGLIAYNAAWTGPTTYQPLALLLTDPADGPVIGGLWGGTHFGYLFIELLYLPEALRRSGLGSRLIRAAEAEALRRGCTAVWLDTFSFQARGFYEKLGYSVFGTLPDCPPGHSRYFLRRQLTASRDA
jgi:GNAT superfamily N-acetyltransferase